MVERKRIDVAWDGFLKEALNPANSGREIAGFLFTDRPYARYEEWYVMMVENVGLKGDTYNAWAPSKKDMRKVKAEARKKMLVKIGNVHTHPLRDEDGYQPHWSDARLPSDTDLKYARKFNDIVRGIVVVDYREIPEIKAITFHDQYSRIIFEFIKREDIQDQVRRDTELPIPEVRWKQ